MYTKLLYKHLILMTQQMIHKKQIHFSLTYDVFKIVHKEKLSVPPKTFKIVS